ncbi:MAG: UvrD-helicase domain-containing protein, partial [Clostridia bacterium]|nr:UvrD-helicase domain-containing protein [Clostridia bacterium]
MAMTWTDAQRAAIDTKDQTLLVSAAAGAGKTAALTERLIRRLTDKENPAHIDRMLIVTFTRAAASELRERIAKALSEALARDPGSRHLSEQIVRLSEAKICTIDAFFLDVVRSNFALVGLPPKFRMADNAELTVLKNSVMNETIERFYRKGNEYGRFFDHFSKVRSDRNLAEVFLSLYSDLGRHPEGLSFLKKNAQTMRDGAEQDYFSTPFGAVSRRYTESLLDAAISMFENALAYAVTYEPMDKAYTPFFSEELAFCRTLRETVRGGDYSASRELLLSYAPRRIATIKKGTATEDTERYKELRKKFNDDIRAMKKDRFLLSAPDIRRAMLDSADVSERLYELLTAYDERIRTEKLRRAICDFDDVRLHTYALLVDENGAPTPLARSYAEHFDEIYIDEYQDVDSIQDLIFRAIAKPNNRFLVGDIKQSIYGFRGANPDVFASYRERFPKYGSEDAKDSPASAIYMSDNFRCDSPIIRFTNTVCGTIFATCEGGLAYRPEDDLIASKKLSDGYVPHKVEVVLLSSEAKKAHADAEKNGEAVDPLPPMAEESEAAYITARIRALLKNGTKADGTPILPRDIAILSRSGSTLKTVA